MRVFLLSTYDLGHQPFGLASPADWLSDAGASVTCNDVSVEPLNEAAIRDADLIAIFLPMHTATRLAIELMPRITSLNSRASICFYGLYAPVNRDHLAALGGEWFFGAEFEKPLLALYQALKTGGEISSAADGIPKLAFRPPRRDGLPKLDAYAFLELENGERRTVAYTEASRGCKHLCRHCPVVPVYGGQFRIIGADVVLADIRQQVARGAQHVCFGDPDFLNGPGHAKRVAEAFHREFPGLTYDVTIKIEHLLKHRELLPVLAETGCLFITTAVESVDDQVLEILEKGHNQADFIGAVALARSHGLVLSPTFLPFTPWTTPGRYLDLLNVIADLDLVEQVAPVQFAIRLLIPKGSRLMERPDMQDLAARYNAHALSYVWESLDPRADRLFGTVRAIVEAGSAAGHSRTQIFNELYRAAADYVPEAPARLIPLANLKSVPQMSEPWYCCAEPTERQLAGH